VTKVALVELGVVLASCFAWGATSSGSDKRNPRLDIFGNSQTQCPKTLTVRLVGCKLETSSQESGSLIPKVPPVLTRLSSETSIGRLGVLGDGVRLGIQIERR
jgi:hypothetical protein